MNGPRAFAAVHRALGLLSLLLFVLQPFAAVAVQFVQDKPFMACCKRKGNCCCRKDGKASAAPSIKSSQECERSCGRAAGTARPIHLAPDASSAFASGLLISANRLKPLAGTFLSLSAGSHYQRPPPVSTF